MIAQSGSVTRVDREADGWDGDACGGVADPLELEGSGRGSAVRLDGVQRYRCQTVRRADARNGA